ncbi:hypothetical protein QBC34DRAFT_30379 [Podospora aff. communis PSN243]|uniref:Uncharacterized protein n=1 Tax=Podospora aff. communis PSN243 TaxID=3040156 RepID=A0AAV9G3Z1_9PEZI|nr:hypothetical protein QBC34DRAFT_30379 [Podospora aff. communis PSN243]
MLHSPKGTPKTEYFSALLTRLAMFLRATLAISPPAPRIQPSRPQPSLRSATMPATILLGPRRPITLELALKKDENIIRIVACYAADVVFRRALWDSRSTISELVKHHLNTGAAHSCAVSPPKEWICIPVRVRPTSRRSAPAEGQTLIFRCVMPHKIAQGAVDEKLSCPATKPTMMSHLLLLLFPLLLLFLPLLHLGLLSLLVHLLLLPAKPLILPLFFSASLRFRVSPLSCFTRLPEETTMAKSVALPLIPTVTLACARALVSNQCL